MANLKTSQESLGSTLSGSELVRITQGGNSVYVPSSYFATLAVGYVVVTVTYAATTTVSLATYAGIPKVILDLTLTGNVTFNLTNGTDGQVIQLRVRQNASGNNLWTSGSNLRFNADITAITLSTGASKLDYIGFEWNGTNSKADVLAIVKGT